MSYGTFTWTPAATGNVIVECWGAGGRGQFGTGHTPGKGGGGGGYSRKSGIAVVSGVGQQVIVGTPGGISGAHESSFGSLPDVVAYGGRDGVSGGEGAGNYGGSTGVGDVVNKGGNGGTVSTSDTAGNGGGASAGRLADGANGGQSAGGVGVQGGASGGAGSAAGNGSPPTAGDSPPGTPGVAPGGGGGGSGAGVNGNPGTPGIGGEGCVIVWEDFGHWPPYGQQPISVYGTAGPLPPPISGDIGFIVD